MTAVLRAHTDGHRIMLRTSGTTGLGRAVVRSTASWWDTFPTVADLFDLSSHSRVWIPGPPTSTMNLFAAVHAASVEAERVGSADRATHAHLTPLALERAVDSGIVVQHYYGAAEMSFLACGDHADDLRAFPGVEIDVRTGVIWARSPFICDGYAGSPGSLVVEKDGWATVGDRGSPGCWAVDRDRSW